MLTLFAPLGIPEWSMDPFRRTGLGIGTDLDKDFFENYLCKYLILVLVYG